MTTLKRGKKHSFRRRKKFSCPPLYLSKCQQQKIWLLVFGYSVSNRKVDMSWNKCVQKKKKKKNWSDSNSLCTGFKRDLFEHYEIFLSYFFFQVEKKLKKEKGMEIKWGQPSLANLAIFKLISMTPKELMKNIKNAYIICTTKLTPNLLQVAMLLLLVFSLSSWT